MGRDGTSGPSLRRPGWSEERNPKCLGHQSLNNKTPSWTDQFRKGLGREGGVPEGQTLTWVIGLSQMRLEPPPHFLLGSEGLERAVLWGWGRFPSGQEKPLRISEGRAKEGRPKIKRSAVSLRPPASHPPAVSHRVEFGQPRARGDAPTHKSWEKDKRTDMGTLLDFLFSGRIWILRPRILLPVALGQDP